MLVPCAAGATAEHLSFALPAEGRTTVAVAHAEWLVVAVSSSTFQFLPSGTITETNTTYVEPRPLDVPHLTNVTTGPLTDIPRARMLSASDVIGNSLGAYVLIRGNLTVAFTNTSWELTGAAADSAYEDSTSLHGPQMPTFGRRHLGVPSVVLRATATAQLTVGGAATSVEYLGFAVSCSIPPCPGGGAAWDDAHAVETLEAEAAPFTMTGRADWLVVGGPQVDLHVIGTIRLPGIGSATWCDNCAGQTLGLSGNLTLEHLHADHGNGFADLLGQAAAASLDERGVQIAGLMSRTSGVLAATAITAVGTAAIRIAMLLFARHKTPLNHPRRKAIFEAVQASPGRNLRGLSNVTGITLSLVERHVVVLKRAGIIIERNEAGRRLFFDAKASFPSDWASVAAWSNPKLRPILQAIQSLGAPSLRELQRLSGVPDIPRATLQYRLNRLDAMGVIAARPGVRMKRYSLVRPLPDHAMPSSSTRDEQRALA